MFGCCAGAPALGFAKDPLTPLPVEASEIPRAALAARGKLSGPILGGEAVRQWLQQHLRSDQWHSDRAALGYPGCVLGATLKNIP